MGVLALSVPLARTSNPSGLRPRRGKDFWFLARSENLRLASSSPVGTFSPNREPVTTPPYVSAGALPPDPRAYALGGVKVFTSSRARKNRHPAVSSPEQQGSVGGSKDFWFLARSENLRLASSTPVGTFSLSRELVTTALGVGAGALPPDPRAYALGGVKVFTSSRARKIFASLVRVQSNGESKGASPRKNVKPNAQKSSPPTHATHPPGAQRGSRPPESSYAYSRANPQA